MSVNEKLMVTVNVAGDISNFQSSIKTIQTELGKLQLPNNLKEGFGQIFNSLNREIEKVQGIAGKKKIDLVDQKQLQKSFSAIENYYNRLVNKMQNSKIKTSLFVKDEKVLSQINSLLTTYNNKVNANAATQKKLNKELEAAQKAYNKINEKPQNSDEVRQVTEHTKALKEQLESAKALEKVKAAALAEKQTDPSVKVIKATKAYKEHEAAVQAVQQAQQAYNAAKAAEPQLKTEAEAAALQRVEETLLNAQKAVNDFNANQSQIETTAWEKLKTDLQVIEGINWKEIGIDPNSIKNAEDLEVALEKIREVAGSSTGGVFGKIESEGKAASASLQAMGEKALQTGQALQDLGDRQRDIQQLASRLTHFFSLTNQFMIMRRIIQNAVTTIKELDKAMTETAVVTDFNVADMWAQLPEYTKVANELGATTKGAYETMTLFYQQGLNQQQAFQLGTETMKMARIAGLDYAEATDRMTNALRGFNMELNDVSSQRVNDVYSNLAAKSASNVDELSTAMTKTASIAHAANMEFETTAAFLAQIIETTRESAETAGTALKTVIARFSEVKKLYSEGELTGQDEEGEEIDVNRVSTALRAAGINLNEYLTGAKGLDQIFIELSSKWNSLDLVTQRYIATMAAGSRQQSRFIALMQDYDRQTELLGYAQNAAGASTEQFNKTLDSLESKLNKLENAWNEFTMGIANSSMIKGAIDLITGLITVINKITNALGPVGGAITKVLLLFAGFKGVRVLFDKFIGHIAKTYIDVARKAGVAGMGAGQAYGKGFLVGSKSALSKFKNIFVDITTKSFKIDSGAITNITKSYGDYEEATKKVIIAQQALDAERAKSKDIIFGTVAAQDLEIAQQGQEAAQKAFLAELEAVGITNDKVQLDILHGKISATELLKAVEDDEVRAKIFSTIATEEGVTATKQDIEATLEDIAAKNALQTTHVSLFKKLAVGIIVLFTHTSAQKAANLVTEEGTLANISLAHSFEFLNKTIMGLPLGWFIAILAGIVALITAISMATHEFSLEGKIEDAANLTKSLDEELKAVQNTLDEFDNHVSSIETLKDELAELTTGTKEWSNKVQELNNQYIELAKLIGSDFWQNATIENGAINVDDKYLQEAQQKILDQQVKLQQESVQASAMTTDLNLRQSGTSLIKDNSIWANMANSLTPAANVMIEGVSSALAESVKDLSSEDIKRLMSAEDMESFNKITSSLLGGLTFDGDDVKEAQTELQNYINEVNSATAQMDASFQLMASNIQDKTINTESYGKVFQSLQSDNLKAIEDVGAEVDQFLFNAPQAIADVLNAKATQLGLEGHDLDNMEAAFDEYVRIMNESYGEGTFKREGWDIKKRTDEGNYEKVDIGAGEVAQRILTDWVNNQDFESAYKEHINNIQSAMGKAFEGEKGRAALERIIGGNFTQEDIEKFGADTFKQLQDAIDTEGLNVEITPILIKGGANAFISELQGQIRGVGIDVNAADLLGATTQKGQAAFLKLFDSKITGNKQDFANALMGLDNLTNAEDFATIMEHLATINFGDTKSWEELPNWLESMGIHLPEDELQEFITQCEELAGAINKIDFTKIEEQLSTLYSSLDKIRSGDIDATAIDEDTYKTLLESGAVNAEDFRKNLATGEYVYIKGQDSLETAIYAAIAALDKDAEAQLEANVQANEVLARLGDNKVQDIKSDLSSDSMTDKGQGIIAAVRQWRKNGIDLDTLGIEGLNNNTDIYSLSDDQKNTISQGILEAIMNGVEGAKAQQDQYHANVDYTEYYQQGKESTGGFSGLVDNNQLTGAGNIEEISQAVNAAAEETENFSAKMAEAKKITDQWGEDVSDIELKAFTLDLDRAVNQLNKLKSALSDSNKELLEAGQNTSNYEEYNKALAEVTEATRDIFGEGVDSTFVTEHLQDIITFLEGTGEAASEAEQRLRGFANADAVAELDAALAGLDTQFHSVQDWINSIDGQDIEVKGWADVTQMISAFIAAGKTAEEAMSLAGELTGLEIKATIDYSQIKISNLSPFGHESDFQNYSVQYPSAVRYYAVKSKKGSIFDNARNLGGGGGGGSKGGGGGGGGGSDKEPEDNRDWKNPYDKLYNAYSDLEKLQRKRNEYEKEYDLLLGQAGKTSLDLSAELQKQTDNLKEQMAIQEDLIEGKKAQINTLQDKTYSVEDGTVKSFATAFADALDASIDSHSNVPDAVKKSKLSDYGYWDDDAQEARINWDLIQSLEGTVDSAVGEIVEAYISELEGLEDQVQEANDTLLDLKTDLKQLIDETLENRVAFIEQIREALIDEYQQQIDKLSALNDAINESNQKIFDSLQEQIDLDRQIRDNTKKEEDIADNEARLAYLQRDTSGANDLEIMKLEQTLEDQRQQYSDQLIDQELTRLQDQADKAAEQREEQIQLMEDQLEFWNDIGWWNEKIEAMSDAEADILLKQFNDWQTKTQDEQAKIAKDIATLVQQGGNDAAKTNRELAAARSEFGGQKYKATYNGQTYDVQYNSTRGGWVGKKGNTEIFIKEADATDVNNDAHTFTASAATLTDTSKKNDTQPKTNTPAPTPQVSYYPVPTAAQQKKIKGFDKNSIVDALKAIGVDSSKDNRAKIAKANGITSYSGTDEQNKKLRELLWAGKLKKYASGGLINFTGPAWLDGSNTKPEMILSAKDTQNFIELKDILGSIMKSASSTSGSSGGDNYFDIKVEVGEIGSDYDVEKMITKIKDEIDQDARYRNVNSINFIR